MTRADRLREARRLVRALLLECCAGSRSTHCTSRLHQMARTFLRESRP